MKQTMRIGMVLLGALTVAMWFGISSTNKKKELLAENLERLEKKSLQKELVYGDMISMIDEVEASLDEIVSRESLLFGEGSEGFKGDQRKKLIREIGAIDDLILNSEAQIQKLNDKVKSSDLKLGVFKKQINALQADLKDRATQIISLKEELVSKDEALAFLMVQTDSLNQSIDAYEESLGAKNLEITQLSAMNDELNKGYLAIGTFDDLKAKGVVNKEGGFLGFIGRTIGLQEDAALDNFMTVDKRDMNSIRIEGTKLNLVSEHPQSSYKIVDTEEETVKELQIVNPDEFWRISKYVVITKKS